MKYNQFQKVQRAEYIAQAKQGKINILAKYFLQADDLLAKIDRVPSIKDKFNFNQFVGRLEMTMEDFNLPIYEELLVQSADIVELGALHNDEIISVGTGKPYFTPSTVLSTSLEKLRTPFANDVKILKDAGVFIAPNEIVKVPMPEWGIDRVIKGDLRFNRMLEVISQSKDFTQDEKDRLYKALGNYTDSGTPIGVNVRDNIISIMKVQPTAELKLKDSIWGADKRDAIIEKVIDDANAGISPNQTKLDLEKSLKQSGVGGAYYKAERVVDTTLQNAYTQAKVDSAREYNANQPIEDLQLVLVRELSASHKVYDMCDELAGIFPLNSGVPMGAIHANCMCRVSVQYRKDVNSSKFKNMGDSYTTKSGQKVNFI